MTEPTQNNTLQFLDNLGLKDIIVFPDRLHLIGSKPISEAQLPLTYVDDQGKTHELQIKLGDLVKPEAATNVDPPVDNSVDDLEWVDLRTNHGVITLELYRNKAKKTVDNFLNYVKAGHYDGLTFHRVINGFMIQGGGFEPGLKQKPTQEPIQNEADNGLKNDEYTIAMARTNDPHSATAQFFINVNNNDFLNHSSKTPQGWGYTVFGRVVRGQQVVDKIKAVKTGNSGFHQDVPVEDVVIEKAEQKAELSPREA